MSGVGVVSQSSQASQAPSRFNPLRSSSAGESVLSQVIPKELGLVGGGARKNDAKTSNVLDFLKNILTDSAQYLVPMAIGGITLGIIGAVVLNLPIIALGGIAAGFIAGAVFELYKFGHK